MLRNKLQSLVTRQNLGEGNNFEIINDQNALSILGGVGTCEKLTSCGTFIGGCPNLTSCTNYTAPEQ